MTASTSVPTDGTDTYAVSREFLGSKRFSPRVPRSALEVHAAIMTGVPYASLAYLADSFETIGEADFCRTLGISTRTLRRQRDEPTRPMPPDLGSKTWLFAETLARAAAVFGSRHEAEAWLTKPATGLDRQRPVDLLQTVQGTGVVNDFLTRLEYSVYS